MQFLQDLAIKKLVKKRTVGSPDGVGQQTSLG